MFPIAELPLGISTVRFVPDSSPTATFTMTVAYASPLSVPAAPDPPDACPLVGIAHPEGTSGSLAGYLLAIHATRRSPAAILAGNAMTNWVEPPSDTAVLTHAICACADTG